MWYDTTVPAQVLFSLPPSCVRIDMSVWVLVVVYYLGVHAT